MNCSAIYFIFAALLCFVPVFAVEYFSVREEQKAGTFVGNITTRNSFKYYFGGQVDYFQINPNYGSISTSAKIDRETLGADELRYVVLSSAPVYATEVVIRVIDINDNAPKFKIPVVNLKIAESVEAGSLIPIDSAFDPDAGSNSVLNYSILNGNELNIFGVEVILNLLHLKLKQKLDREVEDSYYLNISAADNGVPSLIGHVGINITVEDINDNTPLFNPTSYKAEIFENATVGTTLLQLRATDQDTGTNGQIKYSLQDASMFLVGRETGIISLKGILDYETTKSYTLKVKASDGGNPAFTAVATVAVAVKDVNDNHPIISSNQRKNITLVENFNHDNFFFIELSDKDFGPVLLSIVSGDINNKFKITSAGNGYRFLSTNTQLDREKQSSFSLLLRATDSGNPSLHSDFVLVINVGDTNDNHPTFERSTYTSRIKEGCPSGTYVGYVRATDLDTDIRSQVRYSISNGNYRHWFKISDLTGLITTTTDVIDFEILKEPFILLTITASDLGTPALKTNTTFNVTIESTNDNSPVFNQSFYAISINETAQIHTVVLKVAAKDLDLGKDGKIFYEFVYPSASVKKYFDINRLSGEIVLLHKLEYSLENTFSFYVQATDEGIPSRYGKTEVRINVADTDNHAPVFAMRQLYLNVLASKSHGYIDTLTAVDLDSGVFGQIQYSIVAGSCCSFFVIDPLTGVLNSTMLLATGSKYDFSVNAVSNGQSATVSVKLNVLQNFSLNPTFERDHFSFNVDENVIGKYVGKVTLARSEQLQINYYIIAGNRFDVFRINKNGEIFTKKAIDREKMTKSELIIGVWTNESNFHTAKTEVTIWVNDLNDNAPILSKQVLRDYTVNENARIGSEIFDLNAVDYDTGANGVVRYSIIEPSDGIFEIDQSTGAVYLTKNLMNRKNPEKFVLTIQVSDMGTPKQVRNAKFTIRLVDLNNHIPVLSASYYSVIIPGNLTVNSRFLKLSSNDYDYEGNGRVLYKISSGNVGHTFGVFPSGWIYLRTLSLSDQIDYFLLNVSAFDQGNPKKSSSAQVSIFVQQQGAKRSIFKEPVVYSVLKENSPPNISVANMSDNLVSGNSMISFKFGSLLPFLSINKRDGVIKANQSLDREQIFLSYGHENLTVLVLAEQQSGNVVNKESCILMITLQDENDNGPVFEKQVYSATVIETTAPGTSILKFHVVDRDGNENSATIYEMWPSQTLFTIDRGTSTILLKSGPITPQLDYERKDKYNFTLIAKDGKNTSLSSTCQVHIYVSDANDNKPVFNGAVTSLFVSESTVVGTTISTFNATDKDSGENGFVVYYLTSSSVKGTFAINPYTGELYTIGELDYETKQMYFVVITASDRGTPSLHQNISVRIDVTDSNDHYPQFNPEPSIIIVPEDAALSSVIGQCSASDLDSGSNKVIRYTAIEQGPVQNAFKVDPVNCQISSQIQFDREKLDSYFLIIQAANNASDATKRLTSTKNVTISIADVNDNTPVFLPPFGAGFTRTTSTGWEVMTVAAYDLDESVNGTVRYSINRKFDHACFSVNALTGKLTVIAPLSSTKNVFQIEVMASDQSLQNRKSSNALFYLFVFGSPSNAPTCSKGRVNLAENVVHGTNVFSLNAVSRQSNSQMLYIIKSGNTDNAFFLNSSTGLITSRKMIDFELGPRQYNLVVYAIEKSSSVPMTVECEVQIDIQDVNDNAPVFTDAPKEITVKESQSVGSELYVFKTIDIDSGDFRVVKYSIIDGNSASVFSLGASSGRLTLSRQLDRETTEFYNLLVQASNEGSRKTVTRVRIKVADINDNTPSFGTSYYIFTIKENSPHGTLVGQVTAVDSDSGRNGEVYYEILNKSPDTFVIDHSSGKIWLTGNVDYESIQTFILDVKATDYGTPKLSKTVPVFVNIADVNDNCPIFLKKDYIVSVEENLQAGVLAVGVHATDKDSGLNGVVTYQITHGNDFDSFGIDSKGEIRTRRALDREEKAVFILLVKAVDSGLKSERKCMSYARVTVHVLDVNDNPPVLINSNLVSIPESSTVGSIVYTFDGFDKDNGINATVRYAVIESNDAGHTFELMENGSLLLLSRLDFEARKEYKMRIRLSDSGNPVMVSVANVTVAVTDVNDNNPVILHHALSISVLENTMIGSTLIELTSRDLDSGENARLAYSILTGNLNDTFSIEPESGILYLEKSLDHEVNTRYSLEIEVKDHGVPQRRGLTTLSIVIGDVNDVPPSFISTSYNISVMENTLIPNVLVLQANDKDSGKNGEIIYSIERSKVSKFFSIDPNNGSLSIVNALDRESFSLAKLTVLARDNGFPSLTGRTTVFANVLDDNDNYPVIQPDNSTKHVRENLNGNVEVQRLKVTDLDNGVNSTVDISLVSDFGRFQIKRIGNEYVVSTTRGLEREDPLSSTNTEYYRLEIKAADKGNPKRTSSAVIRVFVDDDNDSPPVFSKKRYEVKTQFNSPVGTFVTQLQATDRDTISNSRMEYSIVSGSSHYVSVEALTGVIVTRTRIPIGTTFEIQVEVRDPTKASFKDTTTVAITAATGYPKFTHGGLYDSISENAVIGTTLKIVNATSDDVGPAGKIYYYIHSGNDGAAFSIGHISGNVSVNRELDYETKNIYSLWIEARDSKNPPLSAFVKLVITVRNENDSAPIVTSPTAPILFIENQGSNALVTRVIASDIDNPSMTSRLRFELGASASTLPFVIDSINGEVRATRTLDREEKKQYTLPVIAYPVGQRSLSTATNVIIDIGDLNDNQPEIHSPKNINVSETLPVNSEVMTLNVTDSDEGANGQVTFHLISSVFSITLNTGRITLIKALDRETQSSYMLSISVRDPTYQKIFNLKVTVTDINDSPPYFSPPIIFKDVLESTRVGQVFGTVSAQDNDYGINTLSFYHIEPRSGRGYIAIDPYTGSLSLKRQVNYTKIAAGESNSKNVLQFTVKARNTQPPFLVASGTLFVRIVDANDHMPVFSSSKYTAFVESTSSINHVVAEVSAVDNLDTGVNAEIEYFIVGGNGSSQFKLDGAKVRVKSVLTSYVNKMLEVLIQAKDLGTPRQTSTATLHVTVTEENKYSPVFSKSTYEKQIPENQQVFKELLTVLARDEDTGDNGLLRYTVASGNLHETFAISSNNGSLYLIKPLDYEQVSSYNLRINAFDHGKVNIRSSSAVVRVIVTDVNDNLPVFSLKSYEAKVKENVPSNTFVIQVLATDKDSPPGNTVTYDISSPLGRRYFAIDSASGIIRTRTSIDYEQNSFFDIKVLATDNGSTKLSSSVNVNITVEGVNEFNPRFTKKSYNFSISQFSAINSSVGTVFAVDKDNGVDGVLVYLPKFSYEKSFFSLDMASGVLKVRRKLEIGREIDEAVIHVDVKPLNIPPMFSSSHYTVNVVESSVIGKSVFTVLATDTDAKSGGAITYEITKQSPFEAFIINKRTGLITVSSAIDREQVANFIVTVKAVDSGLPPASNTTSVSIKILDANDNKPSISNCDGMVQENATIGTIVTVVAVRDNDIDPNKGPFVFSIQGSQPFRINAKGELSVSSALDREATAAYNLSIDVTDNGSPPQKSRAHCIITVLDVSDVTPKPRNASVIINTLGLYPSGGLIGDLSPKDPDTTDMYACSLDHVASLFHFETSSCQLHIASHRTAEKRHLNFTAQTHGITVKDSVYIDHVLIANATANKTMVLRLHGISKTVTEFTNDMVLRLNSALEVISPSSKVIRVIGYMRQTPNTIDMLVIQQDRATFAAGAIYGLESRILGSRSQLQQVTGASHIEVPYKACTSSGICNNNGTCYELKEIGNNPVTWNSEKLVFIGVYFEATFACRCKPGFYGRRCEKMSSGCVPNPCRNGAVCLETRVSGVLARHCECRKGFTGSFCEDDVNECLASPCQNSGKCVNTNGGYQCQCAARFTGKNCESTIDFCKPNPCLFGGICSLTDVSFKCTCKFGSLGRFCEINPMTFSALSYLSTNQGVVPQQALNVSLDFATYDKHSLLMYGFHRTEEGAMSPFVALEVINSKLQFSYNFGSRIRRLLADAVAVSDGEWHSVSVFLSSQVAMLKVDKSIKQVSLNEASQSPDIGGAPLYVGGVPSIDPILKRPKQVSTDDFTGCMRNVYINAYHLDQATSFKSHYVTSGCSKAARCTSSPCKNGECIEGWGGAQCHCKAGYSGDSCSEVAKPFTFGGSSFVTFKLKDSYRRKMQLALATASTRKRRSVADGSPAPNSFLIEFRTREKNGLLMYAVDVTGNFTVLHIKDAIIHYKFELKNGESGALVISKPEITDGNWHNISLNVSDRTVYLALDDKRIVQSSFQVFPHRFYSTYTDAVSIAGTQTPKYINGKLLPKFKGCLNRISLNNENLASASSEKFNVTRVGPVTKSCSGREVCKPNPCTDPARSYCVDLWEKYECVEPGQCNNAPCKNNGKCTPNSGGYICNCNANFTGKNCETPFVCLTSPCKSGESCVAHKTKVYECVAAPQRTSGGLSSSEIVIIVVVVVIGIALILVVVYFVRKRQPFKTKKSDVTDSAIEMRHTTSANFSNHGFDSESYLTDEKAAQEKVAKEQGFVNSAFIKDSRADDLNLVSRRGVQFISTSQPAFIQPRSHREAETTQGSNRSLPLMKYQDDMHMEMKRNERILKDLRGFSKPDSLAPRINEPQFRENRRSSERLHDLKGSSQFGTATPPFESGFESTGSDIDSEHDHASLTDIVDGSSQLELYDLEVASIGFSEMSWQNDNNSSNSRDIRRDFIDRRLDRLRHLVPQFSTHDHVSTVSDRNTRSDRLSDRLSDLVEQDSSSDSDGSFTGSEYEYGDERISTNKLNRKHLVFTKHPQASDSDAESSFRPRRNSISSSVTSMTDVGSIRNVPVSERRAAAGDSIPSINWDELLNWAMKYENLADVYRDIAVLSDSDTDSEIVLKPERVSSARASARQSRQNELVQKPVKFYSAQELHSEQYV
eukprot:gene635-10339_t